MGKWIIIDELMKDINEDYYERTIEYNKEKDIYRISEFVNNHPYDEIIFDGANKPNAHCPICDKMRYIPNDKGYCCVCGHHLNKGEDI